MPNVKPQDIKPFARIKVIGVGGSGSNAADHMIASKITGVEYVTMNTDTQDLHASKAQTKIHIGRNLTKGLGSGMNPEVGRQSAEETKAEIQEALKGSDMIFLACGMGGGTGTGASPIVARLAREMGILTVGVVTKPFFFEGNQRMSHAEQGIRELEKEVDALIVIPNDRLITVTDEDTSFKEAFKMCDEILLEAVKGISELITTQGMINIDYADIKTILQNAGNAFMGIGSASGDNRAREAALAAINSPLLDIVIDGAKGVLFAISGSNDLKMAEVHEIAKIVTESIDPHAKVVFGAIDDKDMKKGEIKVTVIATGFDGTRQRSSQKNVSGTKVSQKSTSSKSSGEKNESENKRPQPEERREERDTETRVIIDDAVDDADIDLDDDWSSVPAFLRRKSTKE